MLSTLQKSLKYGNFGENNPAKRPEVREKIRLSKLGSKNPFYGKTHSDEYKKILSERFSGENNPMFGTSRKGDKSLGTIRFGEINPNWKGGLSFQFYPQTFNYKLKEMIRQRDNYTCRNCNFLQTKQKLDIHHIDYDKQNCNASNLISLCRICHSKTNSNREYWTKYYREYQDLQNNFIKKYVLWSRVSSA